MTPLVGLMMLQLAGASFAGGTSGSAKLSKELPPQVRSDSERALQIDKDRAKRRRGERETRIVEALMALQGKKPRALVTLVETTLEEGLLFREQLAVAVAAGRLGQRRKSNEAWVRLPWIKCVAAIRLLSNARGRKWKEAVEGFSAAVENSAVPRQYQQLVIDELGSAWLRLARKGVKGADAISAVRESWAQEVTSRRTVTWHAHQLLFDREFAERGWAPDIVALFDDPNPRVRDVILRRVKMDAPMPIKERLVQSMLDEDAGIRRRSEASLAGSPEPFADYWRNQRGYKGQGFAPVLRRFAERADIPEHARAAAAVALGVRGYRVERTKNGWRTVESATGDVPSRSLDEHRRAPKGQ